MIEEGSEHLDPTAEISLETVKERTVKGVVALTGRYFVLYAITLVTQGFLGAFLTTAQFGIFGIVSAIINFLAYFSDIGLAASLIQKKETVTDEDLKTTFTVQQILVVLLLTILFLVSPKIKTVYGFSQEAMILLFSLGISFLLSSLKTIPSVLLERKLKFEIVAISNILESVTYNLVLVVLAWKGFGITSFTYAVLARGVVGLVTLYIFQPWRIGFQISVKSLKKLLLFGIPYQINTFIAVFKDDGLTLVLGGILGINSLGILVWAQKWIQIPLRVVLDNVTKVTFPAFSRMQDDIVSLKASVTRSIFFTTLLVFPATTAIVILAPIVIKIIPKYSQWTPAIFPLSILAVNVVFAAVTTQLTNLLNAIGKIKITSALMVMWAVLTWLLVPLLGKKYGVNGVAIGYAIVGISSVIAIYIAYRQVKFSLTESVFKPALATTLMSAVLLLLRRLWPTSLVTLLVLILSGITSYAIFIYLIVGGSIIEDVKKTFRTLFAK